MNIVLGIDLGTTNCIASYWDGNKIIYIKNDNSFLFPSIIEFTKNDYIISKTKNNNCIQNFKNKSNFRAFNKFNNKYYTIEKLNSLLLQNIIKKAEKQTNQKINCGIISVPAHFNNEQRESVILSAKKINFNCLRIINEPVAAALSYKLNYYDDKNILIFDLGGGTLDLSIINIDEEIIDVIATHGDNNLGGNNFTYLINKKYPNKTFLECEKIKLQNEFNYTDLFLKIINHLDHIIDISNLEKHEIDHVILVGGATRLNSLQNVIEKYFNKKPLCNIDPQLVVSMGCAIQGFIIKNPDYEISKSITLLDTVSLSIGVESDNGLMTKIINKGDKIPIKSYKDFIINEKEFSIKIYQGERKLAKDNYLLKDIKFNINKNIIRISVSVDINNMIVIKVLEKETNNFKIINVSNKLNDKDIYNMIEDGEYNFRIDNQKEKIIKKYNIIKKQYDIIKNKLNKKIDIKIDKLNNILSKKVLELELVKLNKIADENFELYPEINLFLEENTLL